MMTMMASMMRMTVLPTIQIPSHWIVMGYVAGVQFWMHVAFVMEMTLPAQIVRAFQMGGLW